jgi:hypothetical protein
MPQKNGFLLYLLFSCSSSNFNRGIDSYVVDERHLYDSKLCTKSYYAFKQNYRSFLKNAESQYKQNGSTPQSADRRRATEFLKATGVNLSSTNAVVYALPEYLTIFEFPNDKEVEKIDYQFENYHEYAGTGLYLGRRLMNEILGCFYLDKGPVKKTQAALGLNEDYHLALIYSVPFREGGNRSYSFRSLANTRSDSFAEAYGNSRWRYEDLDSSLEAVAIASNPPRDKKNPWGDNEFHYSLFYYWYLSGNLNQALHSTMVKKMGFESVFLHDALARWLAVEVYGFTRPFRGAPELIAGTRAESRWSNKKSHQFSASDSRFSTLEYKEYFDDLEKRGGRVLLGHRGLSQLLALDYTTNRQDEEVINLKYSFMDYLIRASAVRYLPEQNKAIKTELLQALREWILETQNILKIKDSQQKQIYSVADAIQLGFAVTFSRFVKMDSSFYEKVTDFKSQILQASLSKTTLLARNQEFLSVIVPPVERAWLNWAGETYPAELKSTRHVMMHWYVEKNDESKTPAHLIENVEREIFVIDEGLVPLKRAIHPELSKLPYKVDGKLVFKKNKRQ